MDGNGLPAHVVNEAMAPVQEILNYYSLEVRTLAKKDKGTKHARNMGRLCT